MATNRMIVFPFMMNTLLMIVFDPCDGGHKPIKGHFLDNINNTKIIDYCLIRIPNKRDNLIICIKRMFLYDLNNPKNRGKVLYLLSSQLGERGFMILFF